MRLSKCYLCWNDENGWSKSKWHFFYCTSFDSLVRVVFVLLPFFLRLFRCENNCDILFYKPIILCVCTVILEITVFIWTLAIFNTENHFWIMFWTQSQICSGRENKYMCSGGERANENERFRIKMITRHNEFKSNSQTGR